MDCFVLRTNDDAAPVRILKERIIIAIRSYGRPNATAFEYWRNAGFSPFVLLASEDLLLPEYLETCSRFLSRVIVGNVLAPVPR